MASVEDRLNAVTANFGIWHAGVFLLAALVKVPSAWHMLGVLFKAPDADFWCEQPKTLAHLSTELWINISHPIKEDRNGIKYHDPCEIYDAGLDGTLDREDMYQGYNLEDYAGNINFSAVLRSCRRFHYSNDSLFHETVVTEWHLVCNRQILVNVSQFFYLFGVLIGGLIAAILLPRVGPRCLLLFGAGVQIVAGTANAFVPLFEMNVALKFTAACGCAFMFTAGYMICKDITLGRSRILTCAFYEWFWSFGVMTLPALTLLFGTTSWRLLQIAISVPTTILLLVAYFYLPESPRWLIEKGRTEEAERILRRIAAVNCQPLPGELSNSQKSSDANPCYKLTKPEKTSKWLIWMGLFERPAFPKMVALHFLWATTIVTYYGGLLNVKNLGGNLFLNTAIAGLAEIVGTVTGAILIIFAVRRKWQCLSIIMLTGGISCISSWLLYLDSPEGNLVPISHNWWHQWVVLSLAMIGRIAIACSLALLQVSSSEIASKDQQQMASLSTITFARICLSIAPFVGCLAIYGTQMPLTAFGSLSIIGGMCALVLHLSKGKDPSIYENFKIEKIWTLNRHKKIWTINHEIRMEEKMEYYNQSFLSE